MAYGQTGSGKTFTMGSEAHTEFELTESTGLIPRFMTDLFHHLEQRSSKCNTESGEDANLVSSYTLQASFLEVYGEDVHDLLDPDRPSVPLREDSQGGIVCTGLTSRTIANTQQALAVLHEGTLHRTTAATLMNLTSSRSHAVFTITLQKTTTSATTANENNKSSVTSSRFTFVDLAGSERMKKTGAEGERAREGIEINKGLLALGNVINALADDERIQDGKKKIHVPYRQSKLTRLLQDALGGNSRTLFLACVSPSDTNASETLSTLHYANRARNIKNAPKRNLDATTLELQHWQTYATILQAELVKHKFLANIPDMQRAKLGEVDDTLMQQKQVNEYLDQLQLLTQGKLESNGFNQKTMIRRLPMATVNKIAVDNDPSPSQPRSGSVNNHATDPNHSILETFDVAMLEEVNPDEEMAILNQLLELQQRDQEYDNEQKKDHQILKQVEGELAEQEQLLLQLRDSLKVYHTMKTKYESLMAEVQQLEREKAELQEQLEKASANPTLGCTRAIQKEMEKVERNLIRARSETLKHRELCKKAEHEAQKCRLLEQKVADLKLGRATLIKKQKEAAARHREYTESKTREIAALKRKARNNEQQMTKLQSEIHIHKRNLDKRQALCNKLLQQKKQTEAHLMKLLSLRNRELRSKTTKPAQPRGALVSNRDGGKQESNTTGSSDDNASFAPINEEIKSIQFQIDKAVKEAVTYAELKQKFEERFVEYSEAMRSMSAAVKELENKRPGASEESHSDLELLIEETSLKVEITGSALEKIQSQLAALDNDNRGENGLTRDSISHLTRGKSSTVLRTLLAGIMDNLVQAEVRCLTLS
jgi:kinesin family protein 4/21/27